MRKCVLLLICIWISAGMYTIAQAQTSGENALKHIEYLATDEFKGRKSGTPEYQKAADYVVEKMREYGLQPGAGGGQWFQQVPFRNWHNFEQPIRLVMTSPDRREFFAGRNGDYQPVRGSGSGTVRGELVFAGYGLVSGRNNWNDYSGLDVRGKIVLIIPDAPKSMQETFSAEEKSAQTKTETAIERGAAGIIFMNTPPVEDPGYRISLRQEVCPEGFIVMLANRTFIDYIFYSSNLSWKDLVSKTIREQQSYTTALGVSVEMESHQIQEDRTAPNVIGIIPGSDPALRNEYLLIGGHLDHLGIGVDGFINNGADDDASGVSVVLEVARALTANNFRPKRTVVFCAWAGEELGLVGSTYYTNNPVYPLEKTALYMNMDMVGTGDTDMYIGGMWEFSDFYEIVSRNMKDKFREKLRYRLKYRGSDHTPFIRIGVTCISLRSGGLLNRQLDDEHPEYHLPGDMTNTISAEALGLAAEYHYDIITNIANSEENLLDPIHHITFVHKDATVVDLHCDTVMRLAEGADLSRDNETGHIDIPKLKRGAVDLQVFACYNAPPQDEMQKNTAAKKVFGMIDRINLLVSEYPDDLALVTSYEDLRGENSTGRAGILIGIEGGYAIENDISLLRSFYRSGVRLMTLTHWTRTDWADASGDEEALFGGLTEFGEQVVEEMNELGMVIDVSHVHDETFRDVIRVTKDPVVASHSCCRALSDHFRNMSDEMLRALAENGGMIGINYYPEFLSAGSGGGTPRVDVKTVVDHIDHVVEVTGSYDHVGLGSDFDGITSTPAGLEDTGKILNITQELFNRGYTEENIRKVLGGNFVRILRQVVDN
ncbi:M20/M25/M40 family metallo-hydrolase [candidate division KSB1 bacterium]